MAICHTYRFRQRGTFLGSFVEWGVHLRHDTGVLSPLDIANYWRTNTTPLAAAASNEQVWWTEVVVNDTDPAGEETVRLTITPPVQGSVLGDPLPGQNAAVIQLRTGQKGRRRHGRFYMPGITETDTVLGEITGPTLIALQALANGMISQYGPTGTAGGYHLVVYSPMDTTPPPPRPFKPKEEELITPINASAVDPIVRTQRRRAKGVGR
jgi:hypothetical protein